MSRKRVPEKLHSELSEYSALIRALRTGAASDVVPHLFPSSSHDDGTASEKSQSQETTEEAPSSERDGCNSVQRRKLGTTRWPLLAGDLNVPEWTFEDEIRHLVVQHVSHAQRENEEYHPVGDDTLDEDSIPDGVVETASALTATYLGSILALVVAHTPPRPDSLQNRVEPLNWQSLMSILDSPIGSGSNLEAQCTNHVRARLRRLYHPQGLKDQDKVRPPTSMTSTWAKERMLAIDRSLFEMPTNPEQRDHLLE